LNCEKCGHDEKVHEEYRLGLGNRRRCRISSAFYGVAGPISNECLCDDYLGEPKPKPKLCVCGHPATSHEAEHRYYVTRIEGAAPFLPSKLELTGHCARLSGPCRDKHCEKCERFTAPEDAKPDFFRTAKQLGYWPEDVKQKTATEVIADQPAKIEAPIYSVLLQSARAERDDARDQLAAEKAEHHETLEALQLHRGTLDRRNALIAELESWKKEAMSVMPDYQAIGEELGLVIGDTVHDKILMALKARRINAQAIARTRDEAIAALSDTRESLRRIRAIFEKA